MTTNQYEIGNEIVLTATFENTAGAPTDPTTITCRTLSSRGATAVYTYAASQIVRVSTGVYTISITPIDSGEWWYRFEGTGTVVAAFENTFTINPSQIVGG